MKHKRLSTILSAIFLPLALLAQTVAKETKTFAVHDGQELKLDLYTVDSAYTAAQPCLIFVFGGGFKEGMRDYAAYSDYFQYFARKGFRVISIDYRLGMKGQKAPSPFDNKPLRNAIALAVSDLYAATRFVLQNAQEWNIDTTRIVISGSSAGAITVLQADYELNDNRMPHGILPDGFRYAGVISFAGGIFSTEGTPSYTHRPAPTLFFHGSGDKLVPYAQIRFLRLGIFGSKLLAKHFRSEGYPYAFYSMDGIGHEVSEYPMHEFLPEIEQFINDWVIHRKQWMMDVNFKDKLRKSNTAVNPASYY